MQNKTLTKALLTIVMVSIFLTSFSNTASASVLHEVNMFDTHGFVVGDVVSQMVADAHTADGIYKLFSGFVYVPFAKHMRMADEVSNYSLSPSDNMLGNVISSGIDTVDSLLTHTLSVLNTFTITDRTFSHADKMINEGIFDDIVAGNLVSTVLVSGADTLGNLLTNPLSSVQHVVAADSKFSQVITTDLSPTISSADVGILDGLIGYTSSALVTLSDINSMFSKTTSNFFSSLFTIPTFESPTINGLLPITKPRAITETSKPLSTDVLKTELRKELQNYILLQINAARLSAVAPAIYYSVTNQSESDADRISSRLTQITDGGITYNNFNGAGLSDCTGNNYLTWSGGAFGCDVDDTGSGGSFPFTATGYGVSTSTTIGFLNGFLSTASSTIDANLRITGNATSTNFFSTTASSTNLNSANASIGSLTSANLLVNASSTLQNFTALNFIAQNSTSTSATTTNSFSTTASSSNLYTALFNGAGLTTCQSNNVLTWAGGTFGCEADDNSGTFGNSWNVFSVGRLAPTTTVAVYVGATTSSSIVNNSYFQVNATSTTGDLVVASSSLNFVGNFLKFMNATGTSFFSVGNIGQTLVGTSTNSSIAHMTVSSSTASQLSISSGGGFSQWVFRNAGGLFYLATTSSAGTATSTRSALSVTANGFLGIGTTSPQERLTVDGNLFVTGNSTSTYATTTNSFSATASSTNLFASTGTIYNATLYNTIFPLGFVSQASSTILGDFRQLAGFILFGTTTAATSSALTISTTTASQIALSSGSGFNQWNFRSVGGLFYLATSTTAGGGSGTNGGATSTRSALSITANGFLGIGTTSPQERLTVDGNLFVTGNSTSTNATTTNFSATNATSSNLVVSNAVNLPGIVATSTPGTSLCWTYTAGNLGTVTQTNGTTACGALSSMRFKYDINILNEASGLAEVMALRPVSFKYTPEYLGGFVNDRNWNGTFVGFIAEEVATVDPRLVAYDSKGLINSVQYDKITSILTKAVQEQQAKILEIESILDTDLVSLEANERAVSIQDLKLNLETIASTTASTTQASESFAESFFANIFIRIGTWFADAANGIGDFFANRVHTKELCVGDESGAETCISKSQLDTLIANVLSADGGGLITNPQVSPNPVVPEATSSEPAIESTVIEPEATSTLESNTPDAPVEPEVGTPTESVGAEPTLELPTPSEPLPDSLPVPESLPNNP